MSGGSHDYAYREIERFIAEEEQEEWCSDVDQALRRRFIAHLKLVAKAMQAIEWVDSGDCSPPHDAEAILRVLEAGRKR